MRLPRFRPPKATDPPALVEIDWIDAQSEIDFEGPAHKAGGLVLLPTAGYHIRNGRHPEHGPFVVIAREWFRDEENGQIYTRDTTSIPTGWIRRWSVITEMVQVWPTMAVGTSDSKPKIRIELEMKGNSANASANSDLSDSQSRILKDS